MDRLPDIPPSTATGLFRVAKEAPIRPVTSFYLFLLGGLTIVFSLMIVGAAYGGNHVAALCAASAAVLVLWVSVAFLWHSVRQLNAKVEALTNIIEKNRETLGS